jgi:hypothetical protein
MKKRVKDLTLHKCNLCGETITASGMGSHLYRKHDKLTSQEYVNRFGEFRQKYLQEQAKLQNSTVECRECGSKLKSHKQLIHHINSNHAGWKDYFIRHFFNGVTPKCKCGCGQEVKLLKQGKDEKGDTRYSRLYLQGHDTKTRSSGYRVNTQEQRERMRKSAIERMKQGNSTFHQAGPSKGELEVGDFIKSIPEEIIRSDKNLLNGLEVDILIPSKKIAIEFNGSYFHSDLFKNRTYHLKKTQEIEKKGYRVFHIWESDWYQASDIIKSMIKNMCGKVDRRLYGREIEVREISRDEANTFLRRTHLQGGAVGKIHIGGFYQGTLVQVMVFSKLRKATGLQHKEGSYELLRFSTELNTTVVGGASKLFKYFTRNYLPKEIISYSNRDWSTGNVYRHLGMEDQGSTSPGYFYVKSRIRYSRFQFQKHKLVEQGADPNKTEYEIMIEKGYHRIWDCGNYKFKWAAE